MNARRASEERGSPARRRTWILLLSGLFALFPFLAVVAPPRHVPRIAAPAAVPPREHAPAPRRADLAQAASPLAQRHTSVAFAADHQTIAGTAAAPEAQHEQPRVPVARLTVVVLEQAACAPGAQVEITHESVDGSTAVLVRETDSRGTLELDLAPGRARVVAWRDGATALPATAELSVDVRQELALALEPAWTVGGRVIDAGTGRPVPGARITFWTFAESDVVHSATDGTFRHPRFPPAAPAQQVHVRAPGYGSAVRYLRVAADGTWKLSAALAEESSLRGAGLPWLELPLVPELRVRGRVLGADRAPLAGARVAAEGFFHVLPSVASRDAAEVLTDAEGGFELGGLRSDVGHSLVVEAPGHAFRAFELEAAAERALDLGEVTLAFETVLAGAVIDADGLPLADVRVRLTLAAVEPARESGALDVAVRLESRERRTRTGPEGTFVFEGLEPRVVHLALETEDGPRELGPFAPRADGSFAPATLVLEPDWMAEVAARR